LSDVFLSICIATFRRGAFIGETLGNLLAQATPDVEVLVLDGGSPDNTAMVVRSFQEAHPGLRYIRQETNLGVDRDYDRAVELARGEYCWLMSDDDLVKPGTVRRVLDACRNGYGLVIVNSEVRSIDFSE
jgi:glycosyltransferase involved in cell wall biosynthesis